MWGCEYVMTHQRTHSKDAKNADKELQIKQY